MGGFFANRLKLSREHISAQISRSAPVGAASGGNFPGSFLRISLNPPALSPQKNAQNNFPPLRAGLNAFWTAKHFFEARRRRGFQPASGLATAPDFPSTAPLHYTKFIFCVMLCFEVALPLFCHRKPEPYNPRPKEKLSPVRLTNFQAPAQIFADVSGPQVCTVLKNTDFARCAVFAFLLSTKAPADFFKNIPAETF
ncbi:MAG: hypothetical protein ACI4XQ_06980 [Eubacteriales bacterium]